MAKTIGHTSSGKPVYAAFQLHPSFTGWTADDHVDAAEAHRDAARTDIRTNASMHKNSAALHDEEAQRIYRAVEKLGPRRHSTRKKLPAQLDREIAQSVGKRIDRIKLGEMMHPWSSVGYGPEGTAVYAVASYFDSGRKYPDRTVVERALRAIEADVTRAEHGAHGWTKSDAKDLRTIAQGLRYYLVHDYKE